MLAAIAWLTFSSFNTGVIREAVNLVAGVVGLLLAGLFYKNLADDIKLFTDNDSAARLFAFLIIFAAVALGGHLAGVVLKNTAQLAMLGDADRIAGGILGLLKALIIVEVFLIAATTFRSLGLGDAVDGSKFAPFFLERIPVLVRMLPGEFKDAVDEFQSLT